MKKLRAAAVSFLNAWPLTEGLKQSERIELVLEEPSRCAELLEEGQVDLALVSVAGRHRASRGDSARARQPTLAAWAWTG